MVVMQIFKELISSERGQEAVMALKDNTEATDGMLCLIDKVRMGELH